MAVERILPENREEWLAMRRHDVTSTEVSSLPGIDLNPYRTALDLYVAKVDPEAASEVAPNERMKWGLRLEEAIAKGVAEDLGLNIRALNQYLRDPAARLGASFDYEIVSQPDGPGILEIKTVGDMNYRHNWQDDEAPAYIELQVQAQLALSGRAWALIAALIGGGEIRVFKRQRDEEIERILRAKAAAFWQMVATRTPPPADYTRDADLLTRLYKAEPGKVIDLSADVEAGILVSQYQQAKASAKVADGIATDVKGRLLERIGGAEVALGAGWKISAKQIADSAGTVVTPEMVGTTIGGRRGYRDFRINTPKTKEVN
jgi:putative phage-type endonuclease